MHWFDTIQNTIEEAWYKRFGYPVVPYGRREASRRALLVYLSPGMKWREDDPRFEWHQNLRQSRDLAGLLAERGFRVDVVQYNDRRFVPSGRYDLVVAHPGVVSSRIQELPRSGIRLSLRTGRHTSFIDRAMEERRARLKVSRGWAPEWTGLGETQEVYRGFDAIACFDGNGTTAATFSCVGIPVYPFRNYANPAIKYVEKSIPVARSGFIYMAGQLPLLKGLDWLIELFATTPDRHLFLCGGKSAEITRLYASELALPNIHSLGHIEMGSDHFRRLCERAAWYVSPSASDGCQGTALNAMAAGLVPILSEACGVDAGDVGITLNPCNPESLRLALDEAMHMSGNDIMGHSHRARACVESRYTPRHFREDWNHILNQVGAG
ncbi:MAG: glycosyltransferase [bacterium]